MIPPRGLEAARAVAGLLLLAASCSPKNGPYEQQMREAQRARERADRTEERSHLEQAEQFAAEENDRAEALYRKAHSFLREEKYDLAISELKFLLQEYPNSDRAARSRLDLGRTFEKTGRTALAVQSYRAVLDESPSSGGALSAAKRIVALTGTSDEDKSRLWQGLVDSYPNRELNEGLRFHLAESLASLHPARALAEYQRLARSSPLPEGRFADEALLRAAALRRDAGDREGAVATLDLLLSHDERAHGVGSYVRTSYIEAYLLSAAIFMSHPRDPERAWGFLRQLVDRHPDSRAVDDALFRLAALSSLLNRDACALVQELGRRRPESLLLPCAREYCDSDPPPIPRARCDRARLEAGVSSWNDDPPH